jgi:outer membrane protein TolC
MCSLTAKQINIFFLTMILLSGCRPFCAQQEQIVIPAAWHASLVPGMELEDPACFAWWEAFHDPLLNDLIQQAACRNDEVLLAGRCSEEKMVEAVNAAAAEIARHYIQLRSWQTRLGVLEREIETQTITWNENTGLTQKGYLNTFESHESQKKLHELAAQTYAIQNTIDQSIYHLSTLLSYPPGHLYELLSPSKGLLELPQCLPVGTPMQLALRHPAACAANKMYQKTQDARAFYNYRKQVLTILEKAEEALSAIYYASGKLELFEKIKRMKAEEYQLTQELSQRGLKDEREVQQAYQEMLLSQSTWLETKTELLLDYVNIYQALSTGWTVEEHCEISANQL